jgi:methionine synthase I (cobalamin-dependent)
VIEPSRADICGEASHPANQGAVPKRARNRWGILERAEEMPLVLDAAMGTRLIAAGLDIKTDDAALWSLTHPEHVASIHQRDVAAGADALLTNTFGANRCRLALLGKSKLLESINRRAVQLARSAIGPHRFVLGSMGPTCKMESSAAAEQAAILVSEGVDALVLETFQFDEVEPVLQEVVGAISGAAPVFVSLWEWPVDPTLAVRRLVSAGASVLGLNCQSGANAAVAFAEALCAVSNVPLLVKPGVGLSSGESMTPAELSAVVPKLLENGVRLIGGCCGTTEEHVAAVAAWAPFHRLSFAFTKGDRCC